MLVYLRKKLKVEKPMLAHLPRAARLVEVQRLPAGAPLKLPPALPAEVMSARKAGLRDDLLQ